MDSNEVNWPDIADVRGFCNGACSSVGVEIVHANQPTRFWNPISHEASRMISDSWGGGDKPSPFKVMAAFAISIAKRAPMPHQLPESIIESRGLDRELASYSNAFRASVGFEFARHYLKKSSIGSAGNTREIPNGLTVSRHYFKDFIFYLAMNPDFGMTSLALEASVYVDNPNSRNSDLI